MFWYVIYVKTDMKLHQIAQKGAFVQFCKNTPSHCQSAFEEVQRHFVALHGLVEVVQRHFVALHSPVEVVQRHIVTPTACFWRTSTTPRHTVKFPFIIIKSITTYSNIHYFKHHVHFLNLFLDTCSSENTSSPAESCIILFLKYILIALATIFIELRYGVYNKSMFMCLNYNFYWWLWYDIFCYCVKYFWYYCVQLFIVFTIVK